VSLALGEDDFAAADEWLAKREIAPGFVALAPGSIWGTKRWPGYPELAAALDGQIVLVGGADDLPVAEAIQARAPARVHSAAGAVSLRVSAALIARAGVLVTNDSAPLHLSTAAGTPVVAIFGPTVPEQGFGPRGARDAALGHPALSCRPCSSHGPQVCPLLHHRCMRELAVETVVAAVAAARAAEDGRAIRLGH
jgi:heptosyltransferase-2